MSQQTAIIQPEIGISLSAIQAEAMRLIGARAPVAHTDVWQEIFDALHLVDFRALAELGDGEKLPQKHQVVLCISRLLSVVREQEFDLARKHDFVFAYNGAFWRETDRDTLKSFLGRCAERMGVYTLEAQHCEFAEKLYKQFLYAAHFQPVESCSRTVLINLQNGTFEVTRTSNRLRPFSPHDFLTYQLPFDHDEMADAPLFRHYLNRVLPEKELQNILAEFFGYVFTKHLKLEKALLLYGTGANGKSVLFDVMNALLGKENVTNFSLSDLLQEHNRALISNKLLNYGSEINAATTRDVFKNLVSTEPIQARLKYGQSFLMENYAKLCFNCNELPRDIEQTTAYFRRLLIVPFRVAIPEAEQDKRLADKIIETELSGVFNWILDGLRRLLANERFTESEIIRAEIETYRKESDSVAMFVADENYKRSNEFTTLKDLYQSYKIYCQENGCRALGRNKFGIRLEMLGFPRQDRNQPVFFIAQAPRLSL
jgi:putative DNA primase/helicase